MRLALYSDLHLELLNEPWQPPALDVDVVILAGDIGKHTHGIAWAAQAFRQAPVSPEIVYVVGNHEYYGAHLGLLDEMRKAGRKHGVHVLERDAYYPTPDLRILGCTLWSGLSLNGIERLPIYIDVSRRNINDFWCINAAGGKQFHPTDMLKLHRKAITWLDTELGRPFDGKTIVVTHFAPHRGCVAPQHTHSQVSPYFVTHLSELMKRHQINIWCHGHTHTNNDFVAENGCRVLSNQRGYLPVT